jgi:adenylate cyclase
LTDGDGDGDHAALQATQLTDSALSAVAEGIGLGARMGRYELRSVVGAGGMGMVFEALDPELERSVAVKVLLRARVETEATALRREGQTMARLTHPNVIRIYDVGVGHGHAFVAMEFVRGGTLADWLARAARSPGEIVATFVQAGRGLAAAHDAGLMHRDFKPANVLVGVDGRVLVTDFGIAREVPTGPIGSAIDRDRRALAVTATWTQGLVGTPAYMAPEALLCRVVDARADQFSFCVALWRALFGTAPFPGETLGALIDAVTAGVPLPPSPDAASRVAPALRAVLERGLRTDPAARFPSMHALLAELERACARAVSSIAVLPFDDLSAARDHAYLCDGIAEEILTSLARVDGLRVAARASSFALRASTGDPRAIGEKLGVDAVLAGSVRVAGDRLRVTVQLVASADGTQRWTRRFDGGAGDIFAIQDEIAIGVVTALRGILEAADRRTLRRPETTPDAYEHFLRGRRIVHNPSGASIPLAKKELERAIELDPTYAPAYAMLAQAHAWHVEWYGGGDEARDAAELISRRALEFGPELAEAHVARGAALSSRGEYPEAERAFQRAIELDPQSFDAHYLYGRLCFQTGRNEDAIRLFYRGAELRTEDFQCMLLISNPASRLGREEEGNAATREGMRRAERALELDPENLRALSLGGCSLVRLGDTPRGLEWTRRAIAVGPDDAAALVNAACMFIELGRHDEALDALEGCFGRGWGNRAWVLHDPDYDPLRAHPRFQALIARLR